MIISNSNMCLQEETEDFLTISIPTVVSKKFDDIINEIQPIESKYS